MQNEQTRRLFAAVTERVGHAARDEDEVLAPEQELLTVDDDGHGPVEHEVRLGTAGMTVRGRSSSAGRERALHE